MVLCDLLGTTRVEVDAAPKTQPQMLDTCPSGECQTYTYDFGTPGKAPRPIDIVIHTREAYLECEHLERLMADPGPIDPLAWVDAGTLAYARDLDWV